MKAIVHFAKRLKGIHIFSIAEKIQAKNLNFAGHVAVGTLATTSLKLNTVIYLHSITKQVFALAWEAMFP